MKYLISIIFIMLMSFNGISRDLSKDTLKNNKYIITSIKEYAGSLKITSLTKYFADSIMVAVGDNDSSGFMTYMDHDQYETFLLKIISNYQPDIFEILYNEEKRVYALYIEARESYGNFNVSVYFGFNEKDKINFLLFKYVNH